MSKRTKLIIVICVFVLFIIICLIGFYSTRCSKKDTDTEETMQTGLGATGVTQTIETSYEEESYPAFLYEEATYNHIEYLSFEQKVVIDDLVKMIDGFVHENKKELKSAEILKNSNEDVVFVTVTFTDYETENLVVTYDKYTTHNFMRCNTKEYYDYINSGENAG